MRNNIQNDFETYLAQTKYSCYKLNIKYAEGCWMYDIYGKKYLDLIAGISVSNLGHKHPAIIKAIQEQINHYMHVMVYGDYIQSPQLKLAKLLIDILPEPFKKLFYVNSGSEAIEGSIKLARKFTGRSEIIAFKNAYHGSTLGAMSLLSDQQYRKDFSPLLPEVTLLEYNDQRDIEKISSRTAAVIVEPIQAAAGIISAKQNFMEKLAEQCKQKNCLLIFDEIQTGLGRTGKMFAFEHYNVVPDILVLAKALGAGLPLSLFVSSEAIMSCLEEDHPLKGHATTAGGNPVACAAAYASLYTMIQKKILNNVNTISKFLFEQLNQISGIQSVRGTGLLIGVDLGSSVSAKSAFTNLLDLGLITNTCLFNNHTLQISPPLIISENEARYAVESICSALNH